MSSGTKQALSLNHHRANILGQFQKISIGKYKVMAFNTKHDSAEAVGFLIQHDELGLMIFATDTYFIEYKFSGLNHIFVECNYAKDILQENVKNGRINKALKDRTLKSHFELENVKSFLKANDLTTVHNICLLHLSDNNSDAERFKNEIEDLTGIKTTIADKGTEIELDLVPF